MLKSRKFSAPLARTLLVAAAVMILSGCSKGSNDQPSANVPQTPAENPGAPGTTVQVNSQNGSNDVSTGAATDTGVHVNAPFVNVDVNKGEGGIHVNTPWVHINKTGHGAPTNVDVPSADSNN